MKCMALNQQGMHALIRTGIVRSLLIVAIVMHLIACGGGGGGGNTASGSGGGTLSSSATPAAASDSASTSTAGGQSSATATGSLSLSWVAPVARADGTPLSLADIDGFHIYYGNKAGSYPYRVKVPDGTTQRATLNNLPIGTYYIVMTTYDVDGRESGHSVMVKKTAS